MNEIIVLKIENTPEAQIIDDGVIALFKDKFGNIESYTNHLSVLWELRELVVKQIDMNNPTKSPLFPAFHTINELIGILGSSDEGFREFLKLNPKA